MAVSLDIDFKAFEDLFQHDRGVTDPCVDEELPDEFLILNENLEDATKTKEFKFQRLISQECSEIQQEEMVALMSIYENEMLVTDSECKSFKVNVRKTDDPDETIDLWFSIPLNYPNDLPIFEIESHGSLVICKADELYSLLLEEAVQMRHQTMVYTLVELSKDYLEKNVPMKPKIKKVVEESESSVSDVSKEHMFYNSPYDHENKYKPTHFTGPIHKLLELIPTNLQIVSIENILRHDLACSYEECKDKFNKKYGKKARQQDRSFILNSRLGFHGTSTRNMPSIIRTGLKVPGAESGIAVKNGSAYGVGIYLSPSPEFSLSYSDDMKTLLVCSVLLGHCLKLGEKRSSKDNSRYDSVISPNGFEMIFFSAAQVLPCFIIKLSEKCQKQTVAHMDIQGAYASSIAKASKEHESPDEKLLRVKKRASKYLPFGYGPSTKVLDVADSSDDEEEYGEYQTFRESQDTAGYYDC